MKVTTVNSEGSSYTEQVLSTFISQLLSGVVESVGKQGYHVSFLASKFGEDSSDILSLHDGLSHSIQEQLEVNFKNLIKEAAQERDCSIIQSPKDTLPSNHTDSIPVTDVLAAVSSHDGTTSNTRTVMEFAAHVDTIKVEYTANFDVSLTGEADYSPTTDNDADEPEQYNEGDIQDNSQNEELQMELELQNDLQLENDNTSTASPPNQEQDGLLVETTTLSANPSSDHPRDKYNCKYCEFTARYKSVLTRHIETHIGEKRFVCPDCSYRSAKQANLKMHILTHHGEKPFACKYCSFRSIDQQSVTQHMRTHLKEKPFTCPECPHRSARQTDMRKHILRHEGKKPFACSECSYSCTNQTDLKKHMLIHTGEKPFACRYCPFRSAQSQSVTRHMRTHTGNKPFGCGYCSFRSTQKETIMRHICAKHSGKPQKILSKTKRNDNSIVHRRYSTRQISKAL